MVIALEGNVHSGKTYFVRYFMKTHKNFVYVPETPFIKKHNQFEQQDYYINEEISKKFRYESKDILLDRSIISTLIFTQYTKTLSEQHKNLLINKIKNAISNKNLLFPDSIYIFLCPYNNIIQNHKVLHKTKSTQNILATYDYYIFTLKFLSSLSDRYKIIYNDDERQVLEITNIKLNQPITDVVTTNSIGVLEKFNLNIFYCKYIKNKKIDGEFLKALFYFMKVLNKEEFLVVIKDIYKNIPLIYQFETKNIQNIIETLKYNIKLNLSYKTIFFIDLLEIIKNYREKIS